jgi:hypothetical protein|nr:MAG: hypothetical protein [Bacteriophage sp.]UWF98285.1 MAG: hypothetical protein [Bacteriophage sp.]
MTTTYFAKFNDEGLPEGFIPSFHVNNYGGKNKLTSDGYIEIPLEEYNYYIGNMSNEDNNYAKFKRDNQTGKPVIYIPPEPTQEELQAGALVALEVEYNAQKEGFKQDLDTATLAGNTEAIQSIQQEFMEFNQAYEVAKQEILKGE